MPNSPVKVTVTGAAGPIGYALLFRIASGHMLGEDRLSILPAGHTDAVEGAEGTAMELDDCAFPLLARIDITDDRGRRSTAEHRVCSSAPGRAGRAWNAPNCWRPTAASSSPRVRPSTRGPRTTCKVLVVGNPANTNALIARAHAPDVPRDRSPR